MFGPILVLALSTAIAGRLREADVELESVLPVCFEEYKPSEGSKEYSDPFWDTGRCIRYRKCARLDLLPNTNATHDHKVQPITSPERPSPRLTLSTYLKGLEGAPECEYDVV
jgi:hypothetical protein